MGIRKRRICISFKHEFHGSITILEHAYTPGQLEAVLGNFEQRCGCRTEHRAPAVARRWRWRQVYRSVVAFSLQVLQGAVVRELLKRFGF